MYAETNLRERRAILPLQQVPCEQHYDRGADGGGQVGIHVINTYFRKHRSEAGEKRGQQRPEKPIVKECSVSSWRQLGLVTFTYYQRRAAGNPSAKVPDALLSRFGRGNARPWLQTSGQRFRGPKSDFL